MTGGARSTWQEVVAGAFPEVPLERCFVLGTGQISLAIQVGGDIVVRIPRHRYGVDRLRSELRVLRVIEDNVSVALPRPLAVELDRPVGEAFVAHTLVKGAQLRTYLVQSFSHQTVRHLGQSINAFLAQLQSLTPKAVESGIPVLTLSSFAASLKLEVEVLLASSMTPRARDRARRELSALASADRGHILLCHGNLGGNLLYEVSTGELGAVDFGSAFVSDPVLDLASLLALDRDLALAATSSSTVLRSRLEDAQLVRATYQLQDMLCGARQQDWEYVNRGLQHYA